MDPPLKKMKQRPIKDFFTVTLSDQDISSDVPSDLNSPSTSGDCSYKHSKEDSKLTQLGCTRETTTNAKCVTEDTSAAAPNAASKPPSCSNDIPFSYDIGVLACEQMKLSSLTDKEKYNYLTHECQQSDFAVCEVTKKGKKILLKFQASWLKEYRWLAYSTSLPRWRILQVLSIVCSGNEEGSSWNSCQNSFPKLQQS